MGVDKVRSVLPPLVRGVGCREPGCMGLRSDARQYLGVRGLEHLRNPAPIADQAYPARCPRCGEDRARRRLDTPIRPMRTGFQRVAQVLSDTLMREMPHSPQQSGRKLVVFSDSRQDAAKLSAGMRFAHYRDAVRQALATALETAGRGALAFQRQIAGEVLSREDSRLAQQFAATIQAKSLHFHSRRTPPLHTSRRLGSPVSPTRWRHNRSFSAANKGHFRFPFSLKISRPVSWSKASIPEVLRRMCCGRIRADAKIPGGNFTSGKPEGSLTPRVNPSADPAGAGSPSTHP